jgi:hypothetical protein
MSKVIYCVSADNVGNKLWLKDYRVDGSKHFVKYRSTYNDIPFRETEIYLVDGGQNFAITGDDGTVLYRFSLGLLSSFE